MPEQKVSEREQELRQKADRYMPAGSPGNENKEVVIREGRGGRVRDVSGNEYVDYLLGSGPMLLGHAHPEVVAAVHDQIERGTTFLARNEAIILLAEEIVKAVACADEVRFSSTGTEASLFAMRVARAYRGRSKILKFEGGFHGMNDYALMSSEPKDLLAFPQAAPDSAGIPPSIQAEVLVAPFNDIETTSAIIERHHDELAGGDRGTDATADSAEAGVSRGSPPSNGTVWIAIDLRRDSHWLSLCLRGSAGVLRSGPRHMLAG